MAGMNFLRRQAHQRLSARVIVLIAVGAVGGLLAVAQTSSESRDPQVRAGVGQAGRDPALIWSRFVVRNEAERQALRRFANVVEERGRLVTVTSTPQDFRRLKGTYGLEVSLLDPTIHMRGFHFDPVAGHPARAFAAQGGYVSSPQKDGDYYVVQFFCPPTSDTLTRVRAAGGEVVQYVPQHAFLVFAPSAAIETIRTMPQVRWVGLHQPLFKVSDELRWCFGETVQQPQPRSPAAYGRSGPALYQIAVPKRANLATVRSQVSGLGARVQRAIDTPGTSANLLMAALQPSHVNLVAGLRDVMAMEPVYGSSPDDERVDQIVAGNFVSPSQLVGPGYDPVTQFGVDGTGVTVGVVDYGVGLPTAGGFYLTSNNTVDGPLRGANPGGYTGHSELVASIIAGSLPYGPLDPLGYNYGKGLAPGANIISIPFLKGTAYYPGSDRYTGTYADTVNDVLSTSGPNGVKGYVVNNSWGLLDANGNYLLNNNEYGLVEAQYDGFVQDASYAASIDPVVIVFSAGNYGTTGLTRPKTCKNVITVAACKNLRPELDSSLTNFDDVSSFSSRGPTADGRIKPDLTAPGEGVTGTRPPGSGYFGTIDDYHRWDSGTSASAPLVSAAAALFTQSWKNSHGGIYPSPALIKAALINGAQEMHGVSASDPIPNGNEG
jgi:hypothetical protein